MADNNVTDLTLVKLHIKHEYGVADINIEDVDYEDIIKMETEVVGGYWIHQNMEELLQNKNEDWNLELGNGLKHLLNKNAGKVCENCNVEYKDYCMNCGHLTHIFDNEIKVGIFLRAMRSIPYNILKIKGSLMEGYGVYAIKNIPKGVKFGPYEGLETIKRRNKYIWKIKYLKLVEKDGEDYCNWMRFINCTTTQTKQNLSALQFMGKIYYKTLREIKIGEELLIYYNTGGYNHWELSSIQYFQPDVEQINENIFKCLPCYFGFSEEKYLVNHKRVCPYKKKGVTEINSGTGVKDTEGHTETCERINNIGSNRQMVNENEDVQEKIGLDGEEKALKQDCQEDIKINDTLKKEKLKFPHSYDGCLTTGSLKKQVRQKKCYQTDAILNDAKGKKQKSEHSVSLSKTTNECSLLPIEIKDECNYKANKLTVKINGCSYIPVQKNHLPSDINPIPSYHTMHEPYKCDECSYTSVLKSKLVTHIKSRHNEEKPYKCNECYYATARKDTLLLHIKSHHSMDNHYKCNECTYTSVLKCDLLTHIKSCHIIKKPYKCNECSYTATRKDTLRFHIKSNHIMEKRFKCNECTYAAAQKCTLLAHIKFRHTMEKPYKCNDCSYAAVRKDGLLSHIKFRHTTGKSYKCKECSYTGAAERSLLSHIKTRHTMDKPYKCNECSYASVKKHSLLCHIQSRHTMEKPYKCNECSYASVRKGTLLGHIQAHHSMEKPYKCNECSYAAVQKDHLLAHIKFLHTMEKPYKCNDCSYTAVRMDSLRSHIKFRHTVDKSFKCSECSYTTVIKRSLLSHIKSRHTMDKPYKCNECSYRSVHKCNLVSHIKSCHTMEKPYKCNDCSYAAARKHHLLEHIQSRHAMEKPYKCNECSYTAVQKTHLLSHIKSRHTMEKSYTCNECSFASVRKQNLKRHIKCRHTMEKP